MRSRYRVSLGGVQMDSLDDNLLILDVGYTQPDRDIKKQSTANLNGYDVTDTFVGQQRVTVTFELHIYNTAKRNEACQKINQWADGTKTLKINDRANQYLSPVICEQYADIQSVRNWTDPLTIVFVSTSVPFWQSSDAKTVTLTGKSAKGTLTLDGNTGSSLVSVTVTASATVTSLQLVVGSTTIKLTGISVATGKTVVVDYLKYRYLRIRADGKSVMAKLDPSSSDLLMAECGKSNSVSITANNKVTAVFTARGCWI